MSFGSLGDDNDTDDIESLMFSLPPDDSIDDQNDSLSLAQAKKLRDDDMTSVIGTSASPLPELIIDASLRMTPEDFADVSSYYGQPSSLTTSSSVASSKTEQDIQTLAVAADPGFKLHSVYEADSFAHPHIGPPLGKLLRNCFVFDVIVGDVASPSNFYVRNYRTSQALAMLEARMKTYYTKEMKPIVLSMDNLLLDGHYVLQKGQKFYRVKIVPPFNRKGEKAMINFLDYGGFAQVEPHQLLPLRKAFLSLQTQAWKAKLQVPSWPAILKWSADECATFKSQVEGKSLVALILGESVDDFTKERCLGLVLVDTAAAKDTYIHLQFCDANKFKTG